MKKLLLLTLVLVTYAKPPIPHCEDVMKEAGLSEGFPVNVAHRLHSLTLEDLRYYFEETATEENSIPTVNLNLTKNAPRVLPYTPLFGFDTDFGTQGMRHLDQVLRNMDKADYGITNYSVLEQVAHTMHMAELWNSARKYYKLLEEKSPGEEVCGCVTDIEQNGVLSELELLALKIKYPGVTSGQPDLPYGQPAALPPKPAAYDLNAGRASLEKRSANPRREMKSNRVNQAFDGAVRKDARMEQVEVRPDIRADDARNIIDQSKENGYEISYTIKWDKQAAERSEQFQRNLRKFDFSGDENDVLARAMEELRDNDQGLDKHLDNEEGWESWRDGFKMMGHDNGNFEFAMFIYCKLNH